MSGSGIRVPLQKLDPSVTTPAYAYPGDAGLDLACSESFDLAPFERALIPTGLAIAIPAGYAGLVLPRSGTAYRQGLTLINTPGLIDSQYRGEVRIAVVNLDPHETLRFEKGDRIAQLVITPVPEVTLTVVEDLDRTERGVGGFGSSGVSNASK